MALSQTGNRPVSQFNSTIGTAPSDYVTAVRARCAAGADAPAFTYLTDGESTAETVTFAALDERIRAIAAGLQRETKSGDRVALFLDGGNDFVVAFLACLYAGVIAVPAALPRSRRAVQRLAALAVDAGLHHAICTQQYRDEIKGWFGVLPSAGDIRWMSLETLVADKNAWVAPKLDSSSIAFLQYTSGSTSTPKGVSVTHGNLLSNCTVPQERLRIREGETAVCWLPHYHDMGLFFGILYPLFAGYHCVRFSPAHFLQRPIRWLNAISRYKAVATAAPNFAYDLCVRKATAEERAALDLSAFRVAVNAAEPVHADTIDAFTGMFEPNGFRRNAFLPAYGMAETTLAAALDVAGKVPEIVHVDRKELEKGRIVRATAAERTRRLVACGCPLLEHDLRIVNPETSIPCADGEVGEIWFSGPSVAQGYWDREAESKATFRAYIANSTDGPYLRTGDLGVLVDGRVYVTGRLKDIIIIRGRNLYPHDIERTAESSSPEFRKGCVAAFGIEEGGEERIVLAVEIRKEALAKFNAAEAATTLRSAVARDHDVELTTVAFIAPQTLPKTSSGKTQRAFCKKLFLDGALQSVATLLPDPREPQPLAVARQLDPGAIHRLLVQAIIERTGLSASAIDARQPLSSFGLSSLHMVEIATLLEDASGRELSPTIAYEYPTIDALAHHVSSNGATGSVNRERTVSEPIAIVGMACRFPGAPNIDAFWQLLRDGVDAVREVPSCRWDWNTVFDPEPGTPGKTYTKWGGFLEDVTRFDAAFFNISPREAIQMDPQQRLLLEVAWEAMENAGLSAQRASEICMGTFLGVGPIDYVSLHIDADGEQDAYFATGNAQSIMANRISYILNLSGPSMSTDTACSSALVAVHQACQSLRNRECDAAFAGSVAMHLVPVTTIALSQARMLSPEGRCKSFDASADGYVRGEGCGMIVLKRLADALADKDTVLGVIRGTAINHDGRTNGITAPNPRAQQAVIRAALADGGVLPSEIGYVEAHGTGTPLGDPIEAGALKAVLDTDRRPGQTCAIGSVKTNIGHLETAAGIAGLIKAVLVLRHEAIPANLHLKTVNPLIPFDGTTYYVPQKLTPWPQNQGRRIAGVSAFGFGGSNSHVVIEQAPMAPSAAIAENATRPCHVFALSARTETALQELARQYMQYLNENPHTSLLDFCFSANTGRTHLERRAAILAATTDELRASLERLAAGSEHRQILRSPQELPPAPRIAFLFAGQGSQYAGMGRTLYQTDAEFRADLDHCQEILRHELDRPLLDVLWPKADDEPLLRETVYTQPALFALAYALHRRWSAWGIRPYAVMGHSLGEYAAACAAGAFTIEEGLRLVAARGRLIQSLPSGGAMAAIFASREDVEGAIPDHVRGQVAIAAVNGPNLTTLSGESRAVREITAEFESNGVRATMMDVSHAFHSPLLDPILNDFEAVARSVEYKPTQCVVISNLTGEAFEIGHCFDAAYWREHMRNAVLFEPSIRTLHHLGCTAFLELGSGNGNIAMGRRCVADAKLEWLPSLTKGQDDWRILAQSLASLYVRGADVRWETFVQTPARRIALPSYPFERERFWVSDTAPLRKPSHARNAQSSVPRARIVSSDDLYELCWEEIEDAQNLPKHSDCHGFWIVYADESVTAREAAKALCVQAMRARPVCHSGDRKANGAVFIRDPEDMHELSKVVRIAAESEGIPCLGVVYIAPKHDPSSLDSGLSLESALQSVCAPASQWLRALDAFAQETGVEPRLCMVTHRGVSVSQSDSAPNPLHAALWGFGRTAALEARHRFGKLIDLADGPEWADALARTMSFDTNEPQLAVRDVSLFRARLIRSENATTAVPLVCKTDGTYLLTGGLGALGIKTAEWLVENGARRLLLINRTALPPRRSWAALTLDDPSFDRVAAIKRLESLGAHVHFVQADVGDFHALRQCIDAYRDEQWPPIRGVVHLAGVLEDQAIQNLRPDSFARIAHAKAAGAWNLHKLFDGDSLDFFVLYSSVASLLGAPGQANYAAANAFLDGLASARRASGANAVSINWGPWAEVGMAAQPNRADRMAAMGMGSLPPEEAVDTLHVILAGNKPQFGVMRATWKRLLAAYESNPAAAYLERLESMVEVRSNAGDKRLPGLREADSEQRRIIVETFIRETIANILRLPVTSIDASRSVVALGMDSIMVMDLMRAIEHALEMQIHPQEVFRQPDIARFAEFLAKQFAIAHGMRGGDAPPEEGYLPGALRKLHAQTSPYQTVTQKNPSCLVVLSAARSGSTLLRVMLSAHPDLFGPPELHLLHFQSMQDRKNALGRGNLIDQGLQRALMELRNCSADEADAQVEHWEESGTSIQDVYRALQDQAAPRVLVDKTPTYGIRMETLRRAEELFDRPQYLYLYRHPYGMMESFTRERVGVMFDVGNPDRSMLAEELWSTVNENALTFLESIDPSRRMMLRYEDLLLNPESHMRDFCAFMGLPYCEDMTRPYDKGKMTDGFRAAAPMIGDPNFKKRTKIEPSYADRWRTIVLPSLLGERAQRLASQLGYELPRESEQRTPAVVALEEERI